MALNEFVQTALDEEGYEEGSDGYTKYGSWYGLANADWCVMFISWCANQAGIMTTSSTGTVPNVPKMASTSAMYTWYTNIYDMSGSCIVRAAHNLTATQEI